MTYTEIYYLKRYQKLEHLYEIVKNELPNLIEFASENFPVLDSEFKMSADFKTLQQNIEMHRRVISQLCEIHKVLKEIEDCTLE